MLFPFIYYFGLYLVSAESSIFYCLCAAVHLELPCQLCIGIFDKNIFRLAGPQESAAVYFYFLLFTCSCWLLVLPYQLHNGCSGNI